MARLARHGTAPRLLAIATLVGFGLVLGCAVAAGKLLGLVERPDGATGFDSSITSWVIAHRTAGLTSAARVLSTLGSQAVLTPAVAGVTLVLVWRRRFVIAAQLVAVWGGAIGLYSLTKHFVHRMRPPSAIWLTDAGHTSSFPSGHATQSLATYGALALAGAVWLPKVRWSARAFAVALAIGVGWSRVYLGVHWATDVTAGWLVAAGWIAIVVSLRLA